MIEHFSVICRISQYLCSVPEEDDPTISTTTVSWHIQVIIIWTVLVKLMSHTRAAELS